MTEAWSCDHFQPEMGLLGSAGRQDEKKLKLTYATFESGFFHVFMDENLIFLFVFTF